MTLYCKRCRVRDGRWKRFLREVYVSETIAVDVYRHQAGCGGLAAKGVRVRIAAA